MNEIAQQVIKEIEENIAKRGEYDGWGIISPKDLACGLVQLHSYSTYGDEEKEQDINNITELHSLHIKALFSEIGADTMTAHLDDRGLDETERRSIAAHACDLYCDEVATIKEAVGTINALIKSLERLRTRADYGMNNMMRVLMWEKLIADRKTLKREKRRAASKLKELSAGAR